MDNSKNPIALVGIGIAIGAFLVFVLPMLGARLTGLTVGPVVLGFPTESTVPQPVVQQPTVIQQPVQPAIAPTTAPIAPTLNTPVPVVTCAGTGNIPPLPNAPPSGCILILEWWVPPAPTPCGLLMTRNAPQIPSEAIGTWWYVYPNRPDSHIKEFKAKNLPCEIRDLR